MLSRPLPWWTSENSMVNYAFSKKLTSQVTEQTEIFSKKQLKAPLHFGIKAFS